MSRQLLRASSILMRLPKEQLMALENYLRIHRKYYVGSYQSLILLCIQVIINSDFLSTLPITSSLAYQYYH